MSSKGDNSRLRKSEGSLSVASTRSSISASFSENVIWVSKESSLEEEDSPNVQFVVFKTSETNKPEKMSIKAMALKFHSCHVNIDL